jgi:hypothetical protein
MADGEGDTDAAHAAGTAAVKTSKLLISLSKGPNFAAIYKSSGSGSFSEYSRGGGAFTLFLNDDARFGSKPARWRYRVFFTKERIRHDIPEGS